jgi:RNA polymerase sigma-70 factor (ECF subfamily)
MSYRDIAAALEVPVGTVMTWLHRGRAQLKAALGGAPIA